MKEFRDAAGKGDINKLQALLQGQQAEKDGVNQPGIDTGQTALHKAVLGGHSDTVTWLLKHGADINKLDKDQNTALSLAAKTCNLSMVQLLLTNNAKAVWLIGPQIAKTPLASLPSINRIKEDLEKNKDSNKSVERAQNFQALFSLLSAKVNFQVRELAADLQKTFKIGAVSILPNGLVRFDTVTKILEIQEKLNNNKTQMHVHSEGQHLLYDFDRSKKTAVELNQHSELNFSVPPLVFVVDHSENCTFEFLVKNNFFQHLGYNTICFEYDQGVTLDETINKLKCYISDCKDSTIALERRNVQYNQYIIDFLEQVKKQMHLKYVGVDSPLGEARKFENLPVLLSLKMDEVREKNFTKHWIQESNRCKGGTITIVGVGHHGMQTQLMKFSPEYVDRCIFSFCHTSANSLKKEDPGLKQLKLNFPLGIIPFEATKDYLEADKILNDAIIKKMIMMSEPVQYQAVLEEGTMASTYLKAITALPFKAAVTDEYFVDAILPIDKHNISQIVSIINKINQIIKINPLQPIKIVKLSEQEWGIAVPNINKENAKVIEDAYFNNTGLQSENLQKEHRSFKMDK